MQMQRNLKYIYKLKKNKASGVKKKKNETFSCLQLNVLKCFIVGYPNIVKYFSS